MLRLKHWLTDNVINRALALLLQRIKESGQNYWIFNTYTMAYLILFEQNKHSLGSTMYKNYHKIFFNMTGSIVHVTLEIYTGQL